MHSGNISVGDKDKKDFFYLDLINDAHQTHKKCKKIAWIFVHNDVQHISMVMILESFYIDIINDTKLIKA